METGYLLGTGLIYVEEEYERFEIAYNLGKKAWALATQQKQCRKL